MCSPPPVVVSWLLCAAALGCGPSPRPATADPDTSGRDTVSEVTPEDAASDDTSAPDLADPGQDLSPDLVAHDTADARPDDLDRAEDTPGPDTTTPPDAAAAPCPPGFPCVLTGFVPACFEGRCSPVETCVPTRIPGCCTADADCPPIDGLFACQTRRCANRVCTTIAEPGCCPSDDACEDGLPTTRDRCLDTARCERCPAQPCVRSAILERRFDTAESLSATGFVVIDPQPSDQVTWQRLTTRSVSGSGAAYLGNARCRTYYGGGLDAACRPTSGEAQDSQRVSPTLLGPFFPLPADTPSVATFWLWAEVQAPLGQGAAEPDVLRVLVEPIDGPAWPVASSLELGKSHDWTQVAVDLAPWQGRTVRLRFEFDSLDGQDNLHEGVWLDELIVRPTCTAGGCCTTDADCAPTAGCATTRCLPLSLGSGRVCAEAPATPGAPCSPCAHDAACDDGDPCTVDACVSDLGRCEHRPFCCLERALLAATFDATLEPLTTPPAPAGPRWHVDPGVARFSDPVTGTFADGDRRVSGTLATPPIALPDRLTVRQALALTFALTLSTEWDDIPTGSSPNNPAGLDRLIVTLSDGALTTTLWTSDEIDGTTRGERRTITLGLDRWRGRTVVLRFAFDSGDGNANDFPGPSLDDVAIRLICR